MRTETRARARTLQALYAWDMRGHEDLALIATQVWDDLAISPEERQFASRLVRILVRDLQRIDASLADVTTNWRLERLGAIERSVLRLAAAELTVEEVPARVVIKEAVRLAERFASAQSAKFVNGVIDALARRMGRL
jgi:transcription antitermination protein NusB